LRAQMVLASAASLAENSRNIAGVAYVATEAPEGTGAGEIRTLALDVRGRFTGQPGVVAIASRAGGKLALVVAVNDRARELGLSAKELVKEALSGRGGGNDE